MSKKEEKKIKVNDNCIGCWACIAICEDVFDFDEDLWKAVVKEDIKECNCVDDAISACPVDAINYEK